MDERHFWNGLVKLLLFTLIIAAWNGLLWADEHANQAAPQPGPEETAVAAPRHDSSDEIPASEEHGGGHGEEGGVLGLLEHHLMDSNHYQFLGMDFHLPVLSIGGFRLPITKHTIMQITVAILLLVLFLPMRKIGAGVPHGLRNFFEVVIVFLRDEVIYPSMGEEDGRRYLPYFLTIFFFILFSNLLGMIPYGSSSTGSISVTGSLAAISLVVMFGSGIFRHGPLGYLGSFVPHGVPAFVIPILFPIEIVGVLVKHFALCIRLFANMLAGHAVITVFLGLISSYFIAPVAILGAVAISLLELFVAFLQAYIFTILSALFIGTALHPEH
ncbi:MAG: F0F1 ATP synthase subunit A [bacterium]